MTRSTMWLGLHLLLGTLVACSSRPGAESGALEPTTEQLERLLGGAGSVPFVAVNLLEFRDEEAAGRYWSSYALPAARLIAEAGGRVVWAGQTREVLLGGAAGDWDAVALVWWPSRSAFLSMLSDPRYEALAPARESALARTAILITSELTAAPPDGETP